MKIKFKGQKKITTVTLYQEKVTGSVGLKVNGKHVVYLLTARGDAEGGIDETLSDAMRELGISETPCR